MSVGSVIGSSEPLDDARSLLPPGLTENEVKVLEAWSDPMDARGDKELMEEYSLSKERIRELRRDRHVMSYVGHAFEVGVRANWVSVFKALFHNAVNRSDSNAQRMVLEILGKYAEKHEVHTTGRSVFVQMSDQELMDRLIRMKGDLDAFGSEEKAGSEVFGPSGYSRHTFPTGPAGVSGRSRSGSLAEESVE
mgnify:CR=1 FL=1